jgi:hypothetical protein
MLEQLMNSVKSKVGGQIAGETNLPSGTIDKVFSVIGDVTKKEVTSQMLGGNLSNVMNLFSDKPNNNAANLIQTNITSGVISNLTGKLGLSPQLANTIATIAIPALVDMISKKNKTTPDDDPSPLNEIFGASGKGGMLGGVAKGLLGGLFKKK